MIKKAEVSWIDWDKWRIKCCVCGTEWTINELKPFIKCPNCRTEYFMTNYIFWKNEGGL